MDGVGSAPIEVFLFITNARLVEANEKFFACIGLPYLGGSRDLHLIAWSGNVVGINDDAQHSWIARIACNRSAATYVC